MAHNILTVTGNTGKTLFSFYMAQLLSSTKKRTVMVSTDGRAPVYRMLFPQAKGQGAAEQKSLGKLLAQPVIGQSDIFKHAHVISDNFLMLSYAEHESSLNYPEIGENSIKALLAELQKLADVILVDTSTYGNPIDTCTLGLFPAAVSITSADLKGFYYRQLQPAARCSLYLQTNRHNTLQDVAGSFGAGENVLLLPYDKSLGAAYNGADITDTLPGSAYRKTLLRIAGELL